MSTVLGLCYSLGCPAVFSMAFCGVLRCPAVFCGFQADPSCGLLLAGASNESGVDDVTTTAIFGDLSGYFFGTFKASSIIWQHATPCRLVTDCKMNDLELP